MKRTFAIIHGGLAAAALFADLVYAVLVAAHASEPAALENFDQLSQFGLGFFNRYG